MNIEINGTIKIGRFEPLPIAITRTDSNNFITIKDDEGKKFITGEVDFSVDDKAFDIGGVIFKLQEMVEQYKKVSRLKLTERASE